MKDSRMKELREDSGTVTYSDPLTSFLYQLLRDHLPAGEVEKMVGDIIQEGGQEITFTNGWLAKYANNLAEKLHSAQTTKLKGDLIKVWQEEERPITKALVKAPVTEDLEDDDLAAIKALVEETKGEGPDENVKNSLEESKAALEAMLVNGQLSEDEASRIKDEINDLMGNEVTNSEPESEAKSEVEDGRIQEK